MKRIVSFLLILVLFLTAMPFVPQARAEQGGKLIAITFDDGPGGYTERLLDGLDELGVNVTFFTLGNRLNRRKDTVKRAYNAGHQIANHSYDHSEMQALSNDQIKYQVRTTCDILDGICGEGTAYHFRAPYGSTNERVRSLIGLPLVYWSVDTLDWQDRNANIVKNRIVDNAYDGAIVLLHDIHATTVDGALAGIKILLEQGYELVTVTELFRRRGVTMYNGYSYSQCKPNGVDYGPVSDPVVSLESKGGSIQVTITADPGTDIFYTLDGSDINQESKKYEGPFVLTSPCTLKAVAAYTLNGDRSRTVEVPCTGPIAAVPQFLVSHNVMTILGEDAQTRLYYTLDGSIPTLESTLYEAPVELEPDTIVRAIAAKAEHMNSPVVSGYFSKLGNFFQDVFPQHWFCDAIDRAAAAGYMQGVGGYSFDPNGTLTRAQLVTLLYRYDGAQTTEEDRAATAFTDVSQGDYFYDPVCWAYNNGITQGYGDGTFGPNRPVTRQEMCKFLGSFLTYRGKLLPESKGSANGYKDMSKIASWALPFVESMTKVGMFQGDPSGYFTPNAGANRAQAATVLVRMAEIEATLPTDPSYQPPTEPEVTEPEVTEPEVTETPTNP